MKYPKALISDVLGRLALTGMLDRFEGRILARTHHLLDPAALPPVARPRAIRGGRVRALCNPHNPFHCSMYWFGRLHERGLDDLLRRVLRPGDTLIDVGANFGHVAFLGASLVGPRGRVHAFEPHPQIAELLDEHARSQGCPNVRIHRVALGLGEGEFTLHVNPKHLGASTLREPEGDEGREFTIRHRVRVRRGEDVLRGEEMPGRVFLKIDVEGNEPSVIGGMTELIRDRVGVLALEATPEWQGGPRGIGSMIRRLVDLGLRPFLFNEAKAGPILRPLRDYDSIATQTNVAFARGELGDRLSDPRGLPPGPLA